MAETKTYSIGEHVHGGIVFYVDETGQHGKVVAPHDQCTGTNWNTAVQICKDLDLGGFKDWYLPSQDELNLVYTNLKKANLGGLNAEHYWSSTAHGGEASYQRFLGGYDRRHYFFTGNSQDLGGKIYGAGKGSRLSARAIRAF